ncbi:MAG: DUF1553 domain-containing protein [Armatimonadota bacterium]
MPHPRSLRWLWPTLLGGCLLGSAVALAAAPPPEEPASAPPIDPAHLELFEKRVRPVLAEQCFSCHGEKVQQGGLRLDTLSGVLSGGVSGPALVRGRPEESLLIEAVHHRTQLKMPPQRKLSARQIEDLTTWVKLGAPWPNAAPSVPAAGKKPGGSLFSEDEKRFWAFQPPREPAMPPVRNQAWVRSPIDAFVLSRLEAAGLQPSPPAGKRELLRRATYDLTGLPPTPEEMAAFLADTSPEAFARVVDRLLTSPRYGERWGRHWLDAVRYADSNGLDENLAFAEAWRYRDYVIRAFNQDKPYDQFVQEQLAGDLLPGGDEATRRERLVATGFLALGPKMLAEDDPVKMEMDIIDEQIDTLGQVFLGLTLGCARCHDHKFDPVPAADYYSLAGIFKSTQTMESFSVVAQWYEHPLASAADQARLKEHAASLAARKQEREALQQTAGTALVRSAEARAGAYLSAALELLRRRQPLPPSLTGRPGWERLPGIRVLEAEDFAEGNVLKDTTGYGQGIGVLVNAGPLPNVAEYSLQVPTAGPYRLELRYAAAEARPMRLLVNGRLAHAAVGGGVTGSWMPDTQRWETAGVYLLPAGEVRLRLERPGPFPHVDKLLLAPWEGPADGYPRTAEQAAAELDLNPDFLAQWTAALEAAPELSVLLQAARADGEPRLQALFDDARAPSRAPETRSPLLRQLLQGDRSPFRLPPQPERYYPPETAGKLRELGAEIDALERSRPELPRALGVREGQVQNVRIHLRGNHLTLGEPVPRRFPRILAGESQPRIDNLRSGRLELARWLTQPRHPLTSRVMVNRIWQGHFGAGLVRSPDNFGRLGEVPTHPELLDWLARRFVEGGWSIKRMHRLIMLSSAYQMSSRHDAKAAAKDPENRLYWRMDRRRLEAEAVRDALLAVSGRLDLTPGGSLLTYKNREYVTSTANRNDVNYDHPRRSVYLPVIRSSVYDVFQAFDFGDPSVVRGQRASTVVAPQALFMLNSRLVLESSRAWADRLLAAPDQRDADRIGRAYEQAYGRPATRAETDSALAFLRQIQETLASRDGGSSAAPETRRQAWQSLCRTLLAASEFLYVD